MLALCSGLARPVNRRACHTRRPPILTNLTYPLRRDQCLTALGRHSRRRKVGRDDYVHWEDTWYVVPWEWASATVQVETALRPGGDLRMHRIL